MNDYYEPAPKKKKQALKVIAIVLAAIVLMVCTSFTTVFFYDLGQKNKSVNSMGNTTTQTTTSQNSTLAQLDATSIVSKVKPSVVGIQSVTISKNFGRFGGTGETTSSGTGIILTENGYIATNAHVVSGASEITVYLYDGTEYTAALCGLNESEDLAVLKIDASNLIAAEIGSSSSLREGELVYAMGNPMGIEFSGSITMGLVSSIDREVQVENSTMNLIQHSASISPGNSGGPLINSAGQVVGINSSKIVSTGTEGMGFAIPIDSAMPILEQLKEGKSTDTTGDTPMLGITGTTVTDEMANAYNIPKGVYVYGVDNSKGAYAAGVQSGDIITAIDGKQITTMDELNEVKNQHKAGDTVVLSIYRGGLTGNLEVVLS